MATAAFDRYAPENPENVTKDTMRNVAHLAHEARAIKTRIVDAVEIEWPARRPAYGRDPLVRLGRVRRRRSRWPGPRADAQRIPEADRRQDLTARGEFTSH